MVLSDRDKCLFAERGYIVVPAVLSPRELQVLGALASKVLTGLVRDEPEALRVCRLCDYRVCPEGVCPVGIALDAATVRTHRHSN